MQTTIIPRALKKSDEIRIVAPASAVEKDYIDKAIHSLIELGYTVSLGKFTMNHHHQFAGTDAERAEDFQEAIDDPSVAAIFCARGGYGSIRIIDLIDFNSFAENPKWIAGFSDITVIHTYLNRVYDLATIHSQMPVNIDSPTFPENLKKLQKILEGHKPEIKLEPHELNRPGFGKGKLVGGNLSILYSLQSTKCEIDTLGNILFIEDVGEQLYHVDRMMQNLLHSGKLEGLSGLIVGGLTDMKDKRRPFGKTAEEIVLETVRKYDFPVVFGFPAGHMDNNQPFILGSEIRLTADRQQTKIHYSV
jgi:muramoyltetrapeptide carboxypeptidase